MTTIMLMMMMLGSRSNVTVRSHSLTYFFFRNFFYLFILGCAERLVAACGLSLAVVSRGYSLVTMCSLLIVAVSPILEHRIQCMSFHSCSSWAQQLKLIGSRVCTQQLWHMVLAAPRRVESPRIRDQTCVPCIGRLIPTHCATREVPLTYFLLLFCQNLLFLISEGSVDAFLTLYFSQSTLKLQAP